jgi:hypothetical protein
MDMIKKIKQLIESILEDYLELQDKIVEIGVMTYFFQAGKLSSSKEKKLRQYIEEATDDISRTIQDWLGEHGLMDLVAQMGGDVDNQYDIWDEIFKDTISSLTEDLRDNYISPDEYDEKALGEIANNIEDAFGGSRYFGRTIQVKDIVDFLNYHAEPDEYYEPEDEDDEYIPYVLNIEEENVRDLLIDLKRKQVSQDQNFIRLAKNMVDTIKEVQSLYSYGETKDLVVAFDHLKDLEHANGSLLQDYGDVDWDEVNNQIEDKVKRLVRV